MMTPVDVADQEPQLSLEEAQALAQVLRRGEVDAVVGDRAVLLLRAQQAEAALHRARDELEQRVQERTAALVQAVDDLRREIAERQQMEERVQRQQEALAQREKLAAMGSLLASVAHELNNPLSVVMVQADMLLEENQEGPLAEQARAITQAAERCVRIVRNFLAMARQHTPERQLVDLNTVVAEAVELLSYTLRVDDINVELQLAPDLPFIGADAHQLQQVVVNLITNAHQALREGPPLRRLTLSTRHHPERGRVVLEVADTGPGIPPGLQERIFEPFFTTKPPGVGTGLGLSLCRGIIEGHGGTLQVESQPGYGAIFRIELPTDSFPAAVAERSGAEPSFSAHAPQKTILVVDDEPGIVSALAYILRRDGYVVDTATNGRQALEQLRLKAYDLILCDLRMPELDGASFYRQLAERYPTLRQRVIFLTGDTLGPEARAFLDCVGALRLSKPFRAAEVRQVLQEALQVL